MHVQLITMIPQWYIGFVRWKYLVGPVQLLLLILFHCCVLCIDKLLNVTEKLGCIIVVMAKNVSSICNRLSKESTCVRILEWDKQGERSVQRLLLRLSIVYLSDTLYPINTRPPYLPIAVVAVVVSRLFFLFACEVRSFVRYSVCSFTFPHCSPGN